MSTPLLVLSTCFLLIGVGFLGCFVHELPGPVIAFIGMLVFIFGMKITVVPWGAIVLCLAMLILSYIAEKKLIPYIAEKISDYGSAAKWGAIIGSLIGLLSFLNVLFNMDADFDLESGLVILIIALVVCFGLLPFGCALLFESNSRKSVTLALKPATAAYATYVMGLVLKLLVCFYSGYVVINYEGKIREALLS